MKIFIFGRLRSSLPPRSSSYTTSRRALLRSDPERCLFCQHRTVPTRLFSAQNKQGKSTPGSDRGPFTTRLRVALRNTKVQWYPIPVGLGIGFLGLAQFYRVQRWEKSRREEEDEEDDRRAREGKPRKRKRIKPSGPWSVSRLPDGLDTAHVLQDRPNYVVAAVEGDLTAVGTFQRATDTILSTSSRLQAVYLGIWSQVRIQLAIERPISYIL